MVLTTRSPNCATTLEAVVLVVRYRLLGAITLRSEVALYQCGDCDGLHLETRRLGRLLLLSVVDERLRAFALRVAL